MYIEGHLWGYTDRLSANTQKIIHDYVYMKLDEYHVCCCSFYSLFYTMMLFVNIINQPREIHI